MLDCQLVFQPAGGSCSPSRKRYPFLFAGSDVDRTLIQEILEVVEQAAIASAKLTGMGLKNEADAAAVEAMRERMYKIQMHGRIVIG